MGVLSISKTENAKIEKNIADEEAMIFIRNIEQETNWKISQMLADIKANIAQSYSVSKENPYMSVYLHGSEKRILIKIETKNKEADLFISRQKA